METEGGGGMIRADAVAAVLRPWLGAAFIAGCDICERAAVMMSGFDSANGSLEGLAADLNALVFRTLKSRGVTLQGGREGRKIRVDFPDAPFLLIWSKPRMRAPYVCLEPWCNGPDFVDAPFAIDQKPGFAQVSPGETVSRVHRITIG